LLYATLSLGIGSGCNKITYLENVKVIVKYFFSFQKFLTLDGISEIEQLHMLDVKNLIQFGLITIVVSLINLIFLRKILSRQFRKRVLILFLMCIAVISLIGITNFDLFLHISQNPF